MVAPKTVKVGDVLWDVHREKMGNTTMSEIGSWRVFILELPTPERPHSWKVGWNLPSQVRSYSSRDIQRLRRTPYKKPCWTCRNKKPARETCTDCGGTGEVKRRW